MSQDVFLQTLRTFLRREPFQPFIVEFTDGKQLLIDDPHAVTIGTCVAGFLTPEYDLISFSCEQVRDIRMATQEAAS